MDVRTGLSLAAAEAPLTAWDHARAGLAKIDTRLILTYQPSRCVGEEAELSPADLLHPLPAEPADPPAPPGAGLGLSEAANPQNGPRRYGTAGLTANGARNIQRATAWMQDLRKRLAFWTVTLPDDAAFELLDRDLWHVFQSRIRDLLVRALKRAGLAGDCVGVAELHPSRSMRVRRPVPHLHVVFVAKRSDRSGWALGLDQLDRIIADAFYYAAGERVSTTSAGNCQRVRKNCGAYMAKYMVKNRHLSFDRASNDPLPKTWWFWSGSTRAAVMALILPLPWGFINWIHRRGAGDLESRGAFRLKLKLGDPRAPATWLVSFRGPSRLVQLVRLWQDEALAIHLQTNCPQTYGCPEPC